MNRLKGKTVIVVGAGSIGPGWGNGKATAVTFAREGAQVFCVDRHGAAAEETVNIIKSEGGKAAAFTADVSRASDVEAMVAACMKANGRIDVLDNNVGIAEMGSVVEVSEAEWDRVMAVNLKSAFLAMLTDARYAASSVFFMRRALAWLPARCRCVHENSRSVPRRPRWR